MAREMGLNERAVEQRQQAVGLAAEDLTRIGRTRDLVTKHAEQFARAFFDYLAALEEARDFMRNREMVERARHLQVEHLVSMVGGQYGVDYANQRLRLGRLYTRAGLETRIFLGAFHHLLRQVGMMLVKGARQPDEAFEDFMSLKKVAFLDIGIIIDGMVFERERVIRQQQDAIRELTTPVLQLRDRMLMLPIIGMIDTYRARLLTEGLLQAIRANRARVVVMDVTGVLAVDTKVANHLLQTVAASRLMGAAVIVTGLSAEVSQTLVNLGVDLSSLRTFGDLQTGIEEAERLVGYQVSRVDVARPSSLLSA
ncbi:MAG TPA: protoglobin domain-containing protein [Polyangia bacterium]|nr:protoglobin domain-containing protein [Polyangia bacterium]